MWGGGQGIGLTFSCLVRLVSASASASVFNSGGLCSGVCARSDCLLSWVSSGCICVVVVVVVVEDVIISLVVACCSFDSVEFEFSIIVARQQQFPIWD